jgi:glycosyltransferase involved in cell wall biosynthesis
MRIGLISTACTPVRRDHAGSVESLVWLLAKLYVEHGHDVTVFACAGSACDGRLVATLPGPHGADGSPDDWQMCEWISLSRAAAMSDELDVLHSHVYLWGVPLAAMARCPMVHTQHILPYDDDAQMWRLHGGAHVTALSAVQWSAYEDLKPVAIVPHGVEPDQFEFGATPGEQVCYLGRFTPGKNALAAIELARRSDRRIVLAGPENEYFQQIIAPHVDGDRVRYIGAVDARGRSELLRSSAALIYPLCEPEPFGLVQVEAMLCGTPVVAPRIGAVPEIVDDGITGALSDSVEELDAALAQAVQLDRLRVRETGLARFSADRMARDYLAVYSRLLK